MSVNLFNSCHRKYDTESSIHCLSESRHRGPNSSSMIESSFDVKGDNVVSPELADIILGDLDSTEHVNEDVVRDMPPVLICQLSIADSTTPEKHPQKLPIVPECQTNRKLRE